MFLKNKYTRWYFKIIENAKVGIRTKKSGAYYEAHHIIPQSMGGKEKVLLTAKEHFICHLLLCKMCEGMSKHKMINALIRMTYSKSNGQERYTAKSYSVVRSLIAEKNRELFKGKPKSTQTREKMRGKNGKWIRTPAHKAAMGKRRKGKMMGDENPARRPEIREKIRLGKIGNKHALGNKNTAGKVWANNGKVSTMVEPNMIPNGFQKGRLKKE